MTFRYLAFKTITFRFICCLSEQTKINFKPPLTTFTFAPVIFRAPVFTLNRSRELTKLILTQIFLFATNIGFSRIFRLEVLTERHFDV